MHMTIYYTRTYTTYKVRTRDYEDETRDENWSRRNIPKSLLKLRLDMYLILESRFLVPLFSVYFSFFKFAS